jgi:hypothetical protein
MKTLIAVGLSFLVGQGAIAAAVGAPASANGPAALALASVVAQYSSRLSAHDRSLLARLLDGDLTLGCSADQKISVRAERIICRASDVDITARSCELTFATHKRILKGRRANELNATIAQAGVPSEGAAGSIITSLSQLLCTIDRKEITQKSGGGADCTFNAGP